MPEALERVSGIIRNTTASPNSIIAGGLATLFDGNGKLLRPGLLLIAAQFGKTQDRHYQLAACLEMLHMATLIHDDVIDNSPFRRGAPSAQAQYGQRNAVLLGDYLLSRCFLVAAEYTSAEHAVSLARIISLICGMEIEQNSDSFRADFSLRRYLRKIMGKSALLFSLACQVGAQEAKTSRALAEKLRRIGYNIGMAFQIIDDILDYEGDPALVRKPLGADIRSGVVTLPLICAMTEARSEMSVPEASVLKKLFAENHFTAGEADDILEAVRSSGGIATARVHAARYTGRALRGIAELPPGRGRESLDKLTRRLLVRNN